VHFGVDMLSHKASKIVTVLSFTDDIVSYPKICNMNSRDAAV